jgi:hypothetical protein
LRLATARESRYSEPSDYRLWKARAAALLERQSIVADVMRERDWRQLYINGATVERAAEQAQTHYWTAGRRLSRCDRRDDADIPLVRLVLRVFAAPASSSVEMILRTLLVALAVHGPSIAAGFGVGFATGSFVRARMKLDQE